MGTSTEKKWLFIESRIKTKKNARHNIYKHKIVPLVGIV